MQCPICNGDTCIINTREYRSNTVYRRRKCTSCGARFSTVEEHVGGVLTDAEAESLPKGGYFCSTIKGNVPV